METQRGKPGDARREQLVTLSVPASYSPEHSDDAKWRRKQENCETGWERLYNSTLQLYTYMSDFSDLIIAENRWGEQVNIPLQNLIKTLKLLESKSHCGDVMLGYVTPIRKMLNLIVAECVMNSQIVPENAFPLLEVVLHDLSEVIPNPQLYHGMLHSAKEAQSRLEKSQSVGRNVLVTAFEAEEKSSETHGSSFAGSGGPKNTNNLTVIVSPRAGGVHTASQQPASDTSPRGVESGVPQLPLKNSESDIDNDDGSNSQFVTVPAAVTLPSVSENDSKMTNAPQQQEKAEESTSPSSQSETSFDSGNTASETKTRRLPQESRTSSRKRRKRNRPGSSPAISPEAPAETGAKPTQSKLGPAKTPFSAQTTDLEHFFMPEQHGSAFQSDFLDSLDLFWENLSKNQSLGNELRPGKRIMINVALNQIKFVMDNEAVLERPVDIFVLTPAYLDANNPFEIMDLPPNEKITQQALNFQYWCLIPTVQDKEALKKARRALGSEQLLKTEAENAYNAATIVDGIDENWHSALVQPQNDASKSVVNVKKTGGSSVISFRLLVRESGGIKPLNWNASVSSEMALSLMKWDSAFHPLVHKRFYVDRKFRQGDIEKATISALPSMWPKYVVADANTELKAGSVEEISLVDENTVTVKNGTLQYENPSRRLSSISCDAGGKRPAWPKLGSVLHDLVRFLGDWRTPNSSGNAPAPLPSAAKAQRDASYLLYLIQTIKGPKRRRFVHFYHCVDEKRRLWAASRASMLVLTICAALYKIIRPEAFAMTSDLLVFPLLQNFLTFGCGLLLVNHHERDAFDIKKYSAAQKRMDVSKQFLGRAQTALYYLLPSKTRGIGGLARAAVSTVLYGTAFVLCAVSLLIIAQMSVLMPSGVDAGADVFNAVVFAMIVGTSMGTLTGLFNFRLLHSYALRNWKASPGRAVRMRFMDFGMCLLAVALGVVYWTVIRDVFSLGNAHAIAVPTSGVYTISKTVVRPSPDPRPQGQTAEIVDHQNERTLVLVIDNRDNKYHFEVIRKGSAAERTTISVLKQRGLDATADLRLDEEKRLKHASLTSHDGLNVLAWVTRRSQLRFYAWKDAEAGSQVQQDAPAERQSSIVACAADGRSTVAYVTSDGRVTVSRYVRGGIQRSSSEPALVPADTTCAFIVDDLLLLGTPHGVVVAVNTDTFETASQSLATLMRGGGVVSVAGKRRSDADVRVVAVLANGNLYNMTCTRNCRFNGTKELLMSRPGNLPLIAHASLKMVRDSDAVYALTVTEKGESMISVVDGAHRAQQRLPESAAPNMLRITDENEDSITTVAPQAVVKLTLSSRKRDGNQPPSKKGKESGQSGVALAGVLSGVMLGLTSRFLIADRIKNTTANDLDAAEDLPLLLDEDVFSDQ